MHPSDQPELDCEEEEASSGMSFFDHLEDLRWTLFRSFIAFLLAAVFVGIFISQFSGLLQWPYQFAISGREMQMEGLINTSILGVFSVIFYLLIGGGFSLSLPFILYFVARFVAPGLTERELQLVRPACLMALLLFVLGVSFSFFILAPSAMRASIVFNEMLGFTPLWTAASYYALLTWMVLGVGMAFQFPLVLAILIFINVLTVAKLKAFRRYSIVLFLVIAALVTPTTDPFTFMLLAIPMSILYEGAIMIGRKIERKRALQEAEDDLEV
jgi:sec-independent protein translocase protein TatC